MLALGPQQAFVMGNCPTPCEIYKDTLGLYLLQVIILSQPNLWQRKLSPDDQRSLEEQGQIAPVANSHSVNSFPEPVFNSSHAERRGELVSAWGLPGQVISLSELLTEVEIMVSLVLSHSNKNPGIIGGKSPEWSPF